MQLLFFVAVYLKFTFAQYSYDVYFVFYLHKVLCLSVQKGAQNRKYLVKL